MARRRETAWILGASLFLGLAALGGCGGPFGFIPGGRLDGAPARWDRTWSNVGESGIAEIETDPGEPYSVTVAYTVVAGQLYVNAGGSEKRWARNTVDHPDVRLRIDGAIYDLRAIRVEDSAEIARFGDAWTGQSWFRRDPTQFEEVWIFRLVSRPVSPSHQ